MLIGTNKYGLYTNSNFTSHNWMKLQFNINKQASYCVQPSLSSLLSQKTEPRHGNLYCKKSQLMHCLRLHFYKVETEGDQSSHYNNSKFPKENKHMP